MDGSRVCSVGLEPPPISCLTLLAGDSNYIRSVWQEPNLAPEGGVMPDDNSSGPEGVPLGFLPLPSSSQLGARAGRP